MHRGRRQSTGMGGAQRQRDGIAGKSYQRGGIAGRSYHIILAQSCRVVSCVSCLMERLDAAGAKGTLEHRTLGHHIAGQRIAGLHNLAGRHEYHTLLAPPGRLVSGVSCTRVVRI